MANEENLIPNEERTPEELREMTRKGGIASGKARRKKADLKKAMNAILTAEISDANLVSELESLGVENTYETAVMLSLVKEALKGNVAAAGQIVKLTGANKDRYDISEQRERTKLLKNQNKEVDGTMAGSAKSAFDDDIK